MPKNGESALRKISAILAILMALSGALGFAAGFDWAAVLTSGVFAVALFAAGVAALRGGDLIYLAAAWALYIGMNLAAYVDVIYAFSQKPSSLTAFGNVLLTMLLAIGVLGLSTSFMAHHKERRN
jgi:hypothetical protein